jgi:hypothetical protein
MKKVFAIFVLLFCAACTTSKQNSVTEYEVDFKTAYQAALSSLKDRQFIVKNMDWNSGEIDAYRKYKDGDLQKEIITTVSLEQRGTRVKVRMLNAASSSSAPIRSSELNAIENAFFAKLNQELGLPAK